MKKCTRCKLKKSIDKFYPDKHNTTGFSSICKICNRKKVLEYKRTKRGLIFTIYSTQKATSKKRGYPPPDYSKFQLLDWMLSQKIFHSLFNEWKDSNYDTDLIPSCDRDNDYQRYSLSCIRIVTWKENNERHYKDVVNGINTKHTQKVTSKNKITGEVINHYSVSKASKHTGVNRATISRLINNKELNNHNKYKFEKYES